MERIQEGIQALRDLPELVEEAACWFGEKWGISEHAYRESMDRCVRQKSGIPQWYVLQNQKKQTIAGAGVIDNDFHDRKDLTPNLCALFVEPEYRGRGIAKRLLAFIRRDLSRLGFSKVYLVTDHTEFYEACGWNFFTMAMGEDGLPIRLYEAFAETEK